MASGYYRVTISVSSFCRALVVVGFVCVLLLAGTIQTTQGAMVSSAATSPEGDSKHAGGAWAPVGKEKVAGRRHHPAELDLNHMSKRRVPNGPDPIHNRRAGNSRRPPGQA